MMTAILTLLVVVVHIYVSSAAPPVTTTTCAWVQSKSAYGGCKTDTSVASFSGLAGCKAACVAGGDCGAIYGSLDADAASPTCWYCPTDYLSHISPHVDHSLYEYECTTTTTGAPVTTFDTDSISFDTVSGLETGLDWYLIDTVSDKSSWSNSGASQCSVTFNMPCVLEHPLTSFYVHTPSYSYIYTRQGSYLQKGAFQVHCQQWLRRWYELPITNRVDQGTCSD